VHTKIWVLQYPVYDDLLNTHLFTYQVNNKYTTLLNFRSTTYISSCMSSNWITYNNKRQINYNDEQTDFMHRTLSETRHTNNLINKQGDPLQTLWNSVSISWLFTALLPMTWLPTIVHSVLLHTGVAPTINSFPCQDFSMTFPWLLVNFLTSPQTAVKFPYIYILFSTQVVALNKVNQINIQFIHCATHCIQTWYILLQFCLSIAYVHYVETTEWIEVVLVKDKCYSQPVLHSLKIRTFSTITLTQTLSFFKLSNDF